MPQILKKNHSLTSFSPLYTNLYLIFSDAGSFLNKSRSSIYDLRASASNMKYDFKIKWKFGY